MSAKFLNVLTDESQDLQKQIGCMTGIFQIFDRQNLLAGRRLNGRNHKRLLAGHALSTGNSHGAEHSVAGSPQMVLGKNRSKRLNENQGVSMESSRTSFSSSSCSSFSSLECSKTTQQERFSFDRTIIPDKTLKNSPILKIPNADGRPPCCEPCSDPLDASAISDRRSLDFRDVVKDSINRDSRNSSIKTSPKEEVKDHVPKYRDSPRPMQLSKSIDGTYIIGINGKSRDPVDLNESLRVLVKLKGAPLSFSEAGEPPRSSFETKSASLYQVPKDTRRFSYDGRELSRQSLDSRETSKPSSKLHDLPRLSLDSREGSLRDSNFDSKANTILKDLDSRSNTYQSVSTDTNLEKEMDSDKRSTSVVARLMGLEAMPSLSSAQEPIFSNKGCDPPSTQMAKASKSSQDSKHDQISRSPRSSLKNFSTPVTQDPDSIMKPITSARVSNETAPWKQQDRISIPQRTAYGSREAQPRQQRESVYSEIEKRLKELEFRQSNKDFRALKQILDAMQAKGLLEAKKGDQIQSGEEQNLRLFSVQNPKVMNPVPKLLKGSSSPRTFESPIVIMKPAKSVNKSSVSPSSIISLEGLSPLRKLQNGNIVDKKKAISNNRMAKEHAAKARPRDISAKKVVSRTEDNFSQKAQSRLLQGSSRSQHSARENSGSFVKTASALSPRLQQRKLETERRSRPPLPSSDSNRSQRPSVNRQQVESVSPRGKLRRKPVQIQDTDEQLSESSATRNFGYQGDEISQRSDSNNSLASQVDIEVTSADRSADMNYTFIQQDSRSPSGRVTRKAASLLKQKKPSRGLGEEVQIKGITTSAPEQPSPISVLDASFYQDEWPPSPLKKSPNATKDEKSLSTDECWSPTGLSDTRIRNSRSEINHKKLKSIENLVQKLRELTSSDDKPPTTDHIASLCETQNPDHRYVSEILLASGLLLKDLSSGPMGPAPIQLHPSGHPINPDLFFVVEQTKTGSLCKPETINEKTSRPKIDQEKLHRKLIFDVVNVVLIQKLELTSSGPNLDHLVRARKLTGWFPSGQRLLKELCLEIERLKSESSRDETSDDDIKVSNGEVLRLSEGWEDFDKEVPGAVLEIERSIFKDLIDEVVSGEAMPALQFKSNRRRRQLFAK